jgi:hypothetical protein
MVQIAHTQEEGHTPIQAAHIREESHTQNAETVAENVLVHVGLDKHAPFLRKEHPDLKIHADVAADYSQCGSLLFLTK